MASTDVGLLGQIVDQLKALNKASATDMLREAEALKRAEKLQLTTQQQADFSGLAVDDQKDFQRRFLAGQAGMFSHDVRVTGPRQKRTKELAEEAALERREDLDQQKSQTVALQSIVGWTRMAENHLKAISNKLSHGHLKLIKQAVRITAGILDKEQGPKSLKVHDETVNKNIDDVLVNDKKRNDELDRQRNTDKRDAEEARREMMGKLAGGAGGIGAGRAGAGGAGEEGGFLSDLKMEMAGGATGGLLATILLKMKAIWKFTKLKFLALGSILKGIGLKIFAPWKDSKNFAKYKPMIAKGPRMWPFVLAALIAGSFVALSNEEIDPEEGDGPAGSGADPELSFAEYTDTSNVFTYGLVAMNASLAASLLNKTSIAKRAGDAMKKHVQKTWANAPKNSMRGRIWNRSGFARILGAQAGRGVLRMLGPWGMAAWAAWMIVDWQLEQAEEVREAHEEALLEIINTDDGSELQDIVEQDFFESYARKVGGKDISGKALQLKKDKIKKLFVGKSKENSLILRNALKGLDWTDKELDEILGINTPISNTAQTAIGEIMDNRGRKQSIAPITPLTSIGQVDQSTSTVINQHYYMKGREVNTWLGPMSALERARL